MSCSLIVLLTFPNGVFVLFAETVCVLLPIKRSIVQPIEICAMFALHQLGLSVQLVLVAPPGIRLSFVPFLKGVVGGTPYMAQLASLMHQFKVGGPPSWITQSLEVPLSAGSWKAKTAPGTPFTHTPSSSSYQSATGKDTGGARSPVSSSVAGGAVAWSSRFAGPAGKSEAVPAAVHRTSASSAAASCMAVRPVAGRPC